MELVPSASMLDAVGWAMKRKPTRRIRIEHASMDLMAGLHRSRRPVRPFAFSYRLGHGGGGRSLPWRFHLIEIDTRSETTAKFRDTFFKPEPWRPPGLNLIEGMIQRITMSRDEIDRQTSATIRKPDPILANQSKTASRSTLATMTHRVIDTRRATRSLLALVIVLSSCPMTCFICLHSHRHPGGIPIVKPSKCD